MLCRNIQPRRTLRWQVAPGAWIEVAAGALFPVHATDFDMPGVRDAFDVMVKERMIEVEETDVLPILH
jgi:hypothetical protein